MIWYFAIYGVMLAAAVPCFVRNLTWNKAYTRVAVAMLFAALLVFAVLRSPGVDHDYRNYADWFGSIADRAPSDFNWSQDFFFVVGSWIISRLLLPYTVLLAIFTLLAFISLWAFTKKARSDRWVSLLLYITLCHFFIAQNMTEIRAAVAIPVASLAILYAAEHRRKAALLFFLLAVGFHISAVLALPVLLLFMIRAGAPTRKWIFALLPLGLAIYIVVARLLPLLSDYSRLAIYSTESYDFTSISLFSVYFAARAGSLLIAVGPLWNRITDQDRKIVLCSAVGFVLFIALSPWGTFAWRASEVFGLFDMTVFVLPAVYWRRTPQLVYVLSLLLLGFDFYRSSLQLVGPYTL